MSKQELVALPHTCPMCFDDMKAEVTDLNFKEGWFEVHWTCSGEHGPRDELFSHDVAFRKRYQIGKVIHT